MRTAILCGLCILCNVAESTGQASESERPEAVVERQFDAYNRHDADGVAAAFAPDAEIRTLGDTGVTRGQAALRKKMSDRFKKAPKVHARLIGRLVQGAFVVDHERVTVTPEGKQVEAIGIYEVRNGKIVRLWWTP